MIFINSKKRWSIIIPIGILLIITSVILSRRYLPKPISARDCVILKVEKGNVYQVILASGTVEAENEVLIRCPYTTIIRQIFKEPGSQVHMGDIILDLEDEPIKDEIDKIKDQLELKRNALDKNKLNEFSTTVDLNYNEDVKKLNITSLKSQLTDEDQLLEVGGISPAKIEKTKQEIALAEKELLMVKQKNSIRSKQLKAEEQGLELGIRIQEKELADKVKILSEMHITAPSDGIILSLANKVGEKVSIDNILVRMSDLSTFKIAGSIEDKYADYIKTGRKVYAVIDSLRLPGLIGIVNPVIENSKIQFNVHLEEKSHPKLISNQKITLWIVGIEEDNILRIKNISLFDKELPQVLYVYVNGEAIRREVKTGIKNPDHIQVLSGLEADDKVIIPKRGISAFRNANTVLISN